jgi:type 1 glutamine amidotransferase
MHRLIALLALSACSVSPKVPAEEQGSDGGVPPSTVDAAPEPPMTDNDAAVAPPDAPVPMPVIEAHCEGGAGEPRLLVYTRTTGYVHPALAAAKDALLSMCQSQRFNVVVTSDPLALHTHLATTDVLVLAMVTGSVFPPDVRPEIESWVRSGGGIVGIHTATTVDADWAFFIEQIGAKFRAAPPGTWEGRLDRLSRHPILEGTPNNWKRTDEWFVFEDRPELAAGMTMLLGLDEWSLDWGYPFEYRVGYHPLVWAHERAGGRIVQSAIGHTVESYSDPNYLGFLARCIRWAGREL